MAVDLDDMTDQEIMGVVEEALDRLAPARLSEVIDLVRSKRQVKEEEIKQTLLAEFREKAAQMGMSFESLLPGRRTRSDAGAPLAPKYRGPGGETWSGRGRMPNWLSALEATGHNREEFRIKGEGASS
jgi:DNA-binding protein H-NS